MGRYKIRDVCRIFADGDWIESKDQASSGIRLVQTGNVGNGYFKDKLNKARYISEATFKRLKCTEIFEGDILVSRLPEPVGRACIIPRVDERMITAVDCTIIRPKKDLISPRYLLKFLMSPEYLRTVDRLCTGTTRKRISRQKLGDIFIKLPSLEEQEKTVAKLDAALEKIDRAIELTQQNRQHIDTLFKQELNKVFHDPKNQNKNILEVCDLKSGGTIPKSLERDKGDLLYVKVGDMNYPGNEKYIHGSSRYASSDDIKAGNIIPVGAIIFPKRGGAIATNKKRIIIKPTIVDLNTMALIPKKVLNAKLLYFWFLQYDLSTISNGTSIPQINNYSFKSTNIAVSEDLGEQEKLANRLQILHDSILDVSAQYINKLKKLTLLKQSMLSQAFSESDVK